MLGGTIHSRLMCGAAALALTAFAGAARAEDLALNIAPQPLTSALKEFGVKTGRSVLYGPALADAKQTHGVSLAPDPEAGLTTLLEGTGLTFRRNGDTFLIVQAGEGGGGPQGAGAGDVDALIVTAQKREENIQDVPIAISAFSQEDLTNRQVAGGPDLITQIPNFSFTKTNFTSYSIQIRGIGTQAISATTDPAVAVAFNNTPFIRNRFFEQEFFDLERLEVLRGPQGTLYGRNATAGVVNLISAKPKFSYDAKASVDLANYSSMRVEGMVNLPLVEDVMALRVAGAWTKRDGFALNQMTGAQIDGRDLWSVRASLRFEPTDQISANLIYEHFQEDDDRLRSGKQLCKKHVVTQIGALPVPQDSGGAFGVNTYTSQGCEAVSLYSAEAFQTPNGHALPFYGPTGNLGNPVKTTLDPYINATQSRDLRVIESSVEPDYRAKSDVAELQISVDLTDNLTLSSETAYNVDSLHSLQDYNRFTTTPGAFDLNNPLAADGRLDANGVFCDPQLGCSDRLLLVDLSTSESTQFSQEFRLGSDFEGAFNFSFGANFLRHDALDKYCVFINSLTLFAVRKNGASDPSVYIPNVTDNADRCFGGSGGVGDTAPYADPEISYGIGCQYVDPNPIGSLNDEGRNYFLSKNPYKLISYAAFGEIYYNITDALKLTGGLRFTIDKKQAPQIRSWLLAEHAAGPYPVSRIVDQEWKEPTGRLAIDWKPHLAFTDETLVYGSYAHGYKAGGANPPPPVFATYTNTRQEEELPDTFGPEFVDAFELGSKNTLFGGALTLNLTGFYYDYKGYQTSEIRNRSAVNSNFDAEVWGAELEADWRVTDAFRLGLKGGYEKTRMADGSNAIDLMDRTAGHDDWIVIRPFPTIPSNCILPVYVATAGGDFQVQISYHNISPDGVCVDAYYSHLDPVTGLPYVANPTQVRPGSPWQLTSAFAGYPGFDPTTAPNGGAGFSKDLSGNELPNAPNYTATVTADYTVPLAGDWLLTLHGDYHYQSESWARVINSDPYDRIKAFSTVNASAIFVNETAGWKVMAYVKNVFDETAITGAFLNSDDTGLTTNVFLTEPRLYGVRVTKDWTGLSGFWWKSGHHAAGEPYPVQLEIGGGIGLFDGDTEDYAPNWLNIYSPTFPLPSIQDEDFDLGDTRSVKLTYAPSKDWRVSAAYRFGKTKGESRGSGYEHVAGGLSAGIKYPTEPAFYLASPDNHWRGGVRDSEEHAIADFTVGREMGFGAFGEGGRSMLAAGLRYGDFQSMSLVTMDGIPNRFVPPVAFPLDPSRPQRTHSQYTTSLESERTFEGWGPTVGWDASLRLLGDDEQGHADLDWSVTGGVLFGKQVVDSHEERFARTDTGAPIYTTPVPRHRSENVTVPNLSLSLGLSYSVDRVKVSTGYSYDRFFDVIDGGYKDAETYDRTIHGPFVKLSIGFGG